MSKTKSKLQIIKDGLSDYIAYQQCLSCLHCCAKMCKRSKPSDDGTLKERQISFPLIVVFVVLFLLGMTAMAITQYVGVFQYRAKISVNGICKSLNSSTVYRAMYTQATKLFPATKTYYGFFLPCVANWTMGKTNYWQVLTLCSMSGYMESTQLDNKAAMNFVQKGLDGFPCIVGVDASLLIKSLNTFEMPEIRALGASMKWNHSLLDMNVTEAVRVELPMQEKRRIAVWETSSAFTSVEISGLSDLMDRSIVPVLSAGKEVVVFAFCAIPLIGILLYVIHLLTPVAKSVKMILLNSSNFNTAVSDSDDASNQATVSTPLITNPNTATAPPATPATQATTRPFLDMLFTTLFMCFLMVPFLIFLSFGFLVNSESQLQILRGSYSQQVILILQHGCWYIFGCLRHILVIFPSIRYIHMPWYTRTVLLGIPLLLFSMVYGFFVLGTTLGGTADILTSVHFMPIFSMVCTVSSIVFFCMSFLLALLIQNLCLRSRIKQHELLLFGNIWPMIKFSIGSHVFLALCAIFPYIYCLHRFASINSNILFANAPLLLLGVAASFIINRTLNARKAFEETQSYSSSKSFIMVALGVVFVVNTVYGKFLALLERNTMSTVLTIGLFYVVEIIASILEKEWFNNSISISVVLIQAASNFTSLLYIPAIQYLIAAREGYATFFSEQLAMIFFQLSCALVTPALLFLRHDEVSKEEKTAIVRNTKYFLYSLNCLVIILLH